MLSGLNSNSTLASEEYSREGGGQVVRESNRSGPIRVCYLIDRLFPGGTELQLLGLLRSLDRRQVHPYLALLDGEDSLSRSLEPDGVPILRLGVKSLRRRSTWPKAQEFFHFLRHERIEVLQTYFEDSSFFGVPVARLAGVRQIARTRFRLQDPSLSTASIWTARLINRFVTALVANSHACRESVTADEWANLRTIEVIPNGIDLDRFAGIPDLDTMPDRSDDIVVGMVANLWPVKNPGALIDAARLLASRGLRLKYKVAGRGDLLPELMNQVSKAGIEDQFAFLGGVVDIPEFLQGIRIAVLTSRSEGLPNAVLEYMAAGRAIVATAVGGTIDLIESGVHGLLVSPGDSRALANAIAQLADDPVLAARLGRAARDRAWREFSRAEQARRYETLYTKLLLRASR